MRRGVAVAILIVLVCRSAAAQSTPETFDVASVKPVPSGTIGFNPPAPGRFNGRGALLDFVAYAYDIPVVRIESPEWLRREYFSIDATFPSTQPYSSSRAMLRNLLAERFGLRVRRESRDLPVYALMRAREDGKLGDKLRVTAIPCSNTAGSPAPRCGYSEGPGPPRFIQGQRDWAALNLAGILSRYTRRTVIDRTGLSGEFAFRVEFGYIDVPAAGDAQANDAISLFTALRDQLGLKLEETTAPMEVLVVDEAQRPTPD
jgi:uncharacterized protein (TIGR03435 family)